ncbi:hypothetical protein F383_39335 [Gossypium arboreum]|uniref:Uncharacterized protein n=1 Tax=Gossypium arboreum TaxID=29729 RepID=A0A0B0MNM3_GOSAR|nr:hypothetical protein F383_39335 [Gossypium arboreum]
MGGTECSPCVQESRTL